MADEVEHAGKGGLDFLKQKVGPLPIGVWLAAAVIIFLYVRKRNASTAGTGAQTDPAGNVGTIDPKTGYVYGSSQDQSGLGATTGGSGLGTEPGTSGGSTVAGVYSDNTAWAQAAINYLVSLGDDATAANSAITQYLASQPLTTGQQSMVNLAIQRLGSPPSPPQPGTAPPPIVTPPSPGTVYATNPPSGVTAAPASSTAINVKWNRSTNARGYTVRWGTSEAALTGSTTVAGTAGTTTISGLKPGTRYVIQIQATPAKQGDAFASTSATTAKSGAGAGGGGGHTRYTEVTVARWKPNNPPWNSTLSGIADHYHVSGGASALATLNHIPDPSKVREGQRIKVPVNA